MKRIVFLSLAALMVSQAASAADARDIKCRIRDGVGSIRVIGSVDLADAAADTSEAVRIKAPSKLIVSGNVVIHGGLWSVTDDSCSVVIQAAPESEDGTVGPWTTVVASTAIGGVVDTEVANATSSGTAGVAWPLWRTIVTNLSGDAATFEVWWFYDADTD